MHVVFTGLIQELIYATFLLGIEKTPLPFTKPSPSPTKWNIWQILIKQTVYDIKNIV